MIDKRMNPSAIIFRDLVLSLGLLLVLSACAPQARMGMVKDSKTDISYGSTIEYNLVTDASFYNNRKIKVRTRNTSGDIAFGLRKFTDGLRKAYAENGYEPSQKDGFGLLVDVNVMYSGHIQTNLSGEFSFLGAVAGSLLGQQKAGQQGAVAGSVAGATLGSILGTHVTEDTYIIVAQVTFGVVKKAKKSKRKITFSRSRKLKNIDDPDEEEKVMARGFKKTFTTHVAVFAGGYNTAQHEVAAEVKNRIVRIVGDFI